ncbi:MAG: hypothetical protein HUU21_08250 [Polyangiaceae bacterium]|nr:hypothetical protein [Polyangiaceae bacterium]
MRYEELDAISRPEAVIELNSRDRERVCRALVRVTLFDVDRAWIEDWLEKFLQSEDVWIRGVAATCVGHVARIHRALDLVRLAPLLRRLLDNPATAGKAQDAFDDIEVYISRRSDEGPRR